MINLLRNNDTKKEIKLKSKTSFGYVEVPSAVIKQCTRKDELVEPLTLLIN